MGPLLAVDEEAGTLLFEGASADRLRTVLWRGGLDGRDPALASDEAWHHTFSFSTTGRAYVDTSSRATAAPRAAVRGPDARLLRALGDASCPEMDDAIRVAPEFVSVPADAGVSLDAVLWKPADFDATRRWAVLVEVYGGPGSRTVRDAFSEKGLLWRGLLAQEGILSFSVDGRGTGLRGKEFEAVVHRRLGLLETEDQVRGARWLASQPFVDPARIGISGWSYGGTMAALAMTKAGRGVFRTAVAGAGVMDWRLYDTIYTERYMGLPSQNAAGYEASSVVGAAKSVTGPLLLLHGLLDDNVHVQNTVRLSDALIAAGKPFEQFLYPGAGHGGGGRAAQRDQDARVLDFLRRRLVGGGAGK
jgi:dipeptidyl-peptidase-4